MNNLDLSLTDLLVNAICFEISKGNQVSIESFDEDLLKTFQENYIDVEDIILDVTS